MYNRERNTDFEYPGCDGTFYGKVDNIRLNGKFESRFYKLDGYRIRLFFLPWIGEVSDKVII